MPASNSIWAIVLAIGLCLVSISGVEARPNIVVIFSDDHATKAVSAYGSQLIETKNIDRIAKAGVRFDRAFVGNAICGPSRATLLTGLHSHANGFYTNDWSGEFDGNQQTFPKLLQDAGYQTAMIGKWHLYSDPTGFDHWEVIDNIFEQGSYYNPVFRSAFGKTETTGYVAEIITDKAIKWLDQAAATDQPFLLMYHHKTPHRDWLPGPEELKAWDEDLQMPEPDTLFRSSEGLTRVRQNERMKISRNMTRGDVKLDMQGDLTPEQEALWKNAFEEGNAAFEEANISEQDVVRWKYQRYIKSYLASVKSMDREIGRLLDYLDTLGVSDNTLVLYTSDQGFFLGENGWFDKRWMDEESFRVPLVMQWPGVIDAGSQNTALVQNIDLAPTLLDAAGVTPTKPMHGNSLLPLLSDASKKWRDAVYYHFYENPGFHGVPRHYGIRTERYKLIHYYQDSEYELFDLEADPDELTNLFGKAGFETITEQLLKRLTELRTEYNVPEQDPVAPWYHGYLIRFVEWIMH